MPRGRRGEIVEEPSALRSMPRAFPPEVKEKRAARYRQRKPVPRRVRGRLRPLRLAR